MKSSSALLTASAFRPAWVSTPAVRAAVDTFYFSALASVRPTTLHPISSMSSNVWPSTPAAPRCFATFIGRMPSRLLDTPCRTEHRSESWATPSLCRATRLQLLERLVELLGSSPIPRSFVASCVSFQLRLLPPPELPGFVSTTSLSDTPDGPACLSRAASWSVLRPPLGASVLRLIPSSACRRYYPDRSDGNLFARTFPSSSAFPNSQAVGSCKTLFEACSAFTLLRPTDLPSRLRDPLHQRLQQLRCLRCCSDCYRVERTKFPDGIFTRCGSAPFHGALRDHG